MNLGKTQLIQPINRGRGSTSIIWREHLTILAQSQFFFDWNSDSDSADLENYILFIPQPKISSKRAQWDGKCTGHKGVDLSPGYTAYHLHKLILFDFSV